jgi:hypothetical protein
MTQETIDVLMTALDKLEDYGARIQKEIEYDEDNYEIGYLLMKQRGVEYAWNTIVDMMPDDIKDGLGFLDFYDMVRAKVVAS